MGELNIILSVLLYTFGIILLIVLIVLGIKVINIIDKADRILDNVEGKINSLNGLFMVVNKASDGLCTITENLVFSITNSISRIFGRKKERKEDNNE